MIVANNFGSTTRDTKVAVHELGHYFNLYHTFEHGCANNDCMFDGDQVCDTPPDGSTAYVNPCSATTNTCHTDEDDHSDANPFRPTSLGGKGDQNDLTNNYMDYNDVGCLNSFTPGQKERMVSSLLFFRNSLLSSHGCEAPCLTKIHAGIAASAKIIGSGNKVIFRSQTSGATEFQWQINDKPFSNAKDTSFIFNQSGIYIVKLIAKNNQTICTTWDTVRIQVSCPVKAAFTTASSKVMEGDSIHFDNLTQHASNYNWYLNGTLVSNKLDFGYKFTSSGSYLVSLATTNGLCSDSIAEVFNVASSCVKERKYKQADIWLLGDSTEINFNSGATVVKRKSKDNYYYYASISDDKGDLKLVGESPWHAHKDLRNKLDSSIYNGDCVADHGYDISGPIIVPQPNSSSIYYLFHFGTCLCSGDCAYPGYYYTVMDMNARGGQGEVISKNNLLLNTYNAKGESQQALTAVLHRNNSDVWIILPDPESNCYYSYLLTSQGLKTSPVKTCLGTSHIAGPYSYVGSIKASPDGKKVVYGLQGESNWELYDFNNSTGVLSNPIKIVSGRTDKTTSVAEFSPDGSKLYVMNGYCNPSQLWQLDLSLGNANDIINSKTLISSKTSSEPQFTFVDTYQGIQQAPDGRIYISYGNISIAPGFENEAKYLGVITDPNNAGTGCNFISNGIYVGEEVRGLPNYVSSYFYTHFKIKGPDVVCEKDSNVVYTTDYNRGNRYTWEVKGPSAINQSDDNIASLKFPSSGSATLIVTTNNCGHMEEDSLVVEVKPSPKINLGNDTLICSDSFKGFSIHGDANYSHYLWQDGSTNSTFDVKKPGTYWLTIHGDYNCSATDSINIRYDKALSLHLKDTTICQGASITFDAGEGYSTIWQDGNTNRYYTAFLPGLYKVTISNQCGILSDSAQVDIHPFPVVSFSGLDSSYCMSKNEIPLVGIPTGGTFYGPGINNQMFVPSKAGYGKTSITYEYSNVNGCKGSVTQSTLINDECFFIPNLITSNNDNHNDQFEIIGMGENCSLEIYNSWGELIYKNSNYSNEWSASDVKSGVYFYTFFNPYNQKHYKGWVEVVK